MLVVGMVLVVVMMMMMLMMTDKDGDYGISDNAIVIQVC